MNNTYDKQGRLHSFDDKPAYIGGTGTKLWYKHDKIHRGKDKPAVVKKDGEKKWFKDGIRYYPKKEFKICRYVYR